MFRGSPADLRRLQLKPDTPSYSHLDFVCFLLFDCGSLTLDIPVQDGLVLTRKLMRLTRWV